MFSSVFTLKLIIDSANFTTSQAGHLSYKCSLCLLGCLCFAPVRAEQTSSGHLAPQSPLPPFSWSATHSCGMLCNKKESYNQLSSVKSHLYFISFKMNFLICSNIPKCTIYINPIFLHFYSKFFYLSNIIRNTFFYSVLIDEFII